MFFLTLSTSQRASPEMGANGEKKTRRREQAVASLIVVPARGDEGGFPFHDVAFRYSFPASLFPDSVWDRKGPEAYIFKIYSGMHSFIQIDSYSTFLVMISFTTTTRT